MCRISSDSGFFSPCGMHLLMKWMGLIPPWPHLYLKLFYSFFTFFYLTILFYWRFSFNYDMVYDFLHDYFSRFVDLINFVVLICVNFIIMIELLWRNRSAEIDQEIGNIYYKFYIQLGREVNYQRSRRYCIAVFVSFFMRSILMLVMTIYCVIVTTTSDLLLYSFYSEIVLMLRFSQFTLYAAIILAIYRDLTEVSSTLINELRRPRFEGCSESISILDKLCAIQEIHRLLWEMVRNIERNFDLSLITILLKFFVDITVLPYWLYFNFPEPIFLDVQRYCLVEEFCKVMEVLVPCFICTRCEQMQRNFRSLFHRISLDRQSAQLDSHSRIINITMQLGQESCRFSVGGFLIINNEMLGKFIFGVVTYIVICIQFRINFLASNPANNGFAIRNITRI